ncbi:MAG: protein kinase [Acidobacteria bacterium]|nr:protein kinase [Acidobacteriota bacterium]
MSLAPGDTFGGYQITGTLGAGAMGEVYRARDPRLKREVAIKVLSEAVAGDPERVARFHREAELLATLNHPNIGAVYGLETADGRTGLVLELVEGDTLAARIARGGAMPLDEALAIARQIVDALEAAHEKGIVHRDLKPANIKITPEGTVKILDFGIAKMLEPERDASAVGLTAAPTLGEHATFAGEILGTAPYMSPEQARGKPVDRRTDIFAFGCVLYEMLTGRAAFAGEDVAAVLARVIEREPDWSALPAHVPPRVRELLRLCLEKNPKQRRQAASDVRIDLELALAEPAPAVVERPAPSGRPARRMWIVAAATAIVAAALGGLGVWLTVRPPSSRVTRTAIIPGPSVPLTITTTSRDLAIAPDGSRIVYVGADASRLVVRALDSLEPTALGGLGIVSHPVFSPDGQWIAFFDGTASLKKVAAAGGPAVTLAPLTGQPRGASWSSDDTIIFATLDSRTGLLRVPAAGGEPHALTTPDTTRGEVDHVWPEPLPGGDAVLFTILGQGGAQVAVLNLRTGERRVMLRGSHAQYVAPEYLVYGAGSGLWAVRFNRQRMEVAGSPVPVIDGVVTTTTGAVDASISNDGTLVYAPRVGADTPRMRLLWVDRQGRAEPLAVAPRAYLSPRLSPDGTKVVVTVSPGPEGGLWILDLTRQAESRFTTAGGNAIWTPDGRRLVWSSAREVFWQAADGTGATERLADANASLAVAAPYAVSPDGSRLVLRGDGAGTGVDLMVLTLTGERRLTPLIQTRFDERNADISPDGRWLTYESNESGQPEIYVRPFPAVDAGRWQASTTGGRWPLWSRDGRELFFRTLEGALLRVPVETADTSLKLGTPTRLLAARYYTGSAFGPRPYDVSPDGQRFLTMREGAGEDDAPAPPQIVVVQNWGEELKRLVPTP